MRRQDQHPYNVEHNNFPPASEAESRSNPQYGVGPPPVARRRIPVQQSHHVPGLTVVAEEKNPAQYESDEWMQHHGHHPLQGAHQLADERGIDTYDHHIQAAYGIGARILPDRHARRPVGGEIEAGYGIGKRQVDKNRLAHGVDNGAAQGTVEYHPSTNGNRQSPQRWPNVVDYSHLAQQRLQQQAMSPQHLRGFLSPQQISPQQQQISPSASVEPAVSRQSTPASSELWPAGPPVLASPYLKLRSRPDQLA